MQNTRFLYRQKFKYHFFFIFLIQYPIQGAFPSPFACFEERTDKKELTPLYDSLLGGAGKKLADILVKYPSVRGKAVIIKVKVSKTYRGLEEKCEEALTQIREKKYEEELRQEGYEDILKCTVSFYKKECMARIERQKGKVFLYPTPGL